jgi:hypothetical protein
MSAESSKSQSTKPFSLSKGKATLDSSNTDSDNDSDYKSTDFELRSLQKQSNFTPVKMTESTSNIKVMLPEAQRLKGEENYAQWVEAIRDIIFANGLDQHIHERAIPPKQVDPYDPEVPEAEKLLWRQWSMGDRSTMIVIRQNCKTNPAGLLMGVTTARKMWTTLQTQYEGSGQVVLYTAIVKFHSISYDDYTNLDSFVIAYQQSIDKIRTIKQTAAVPEDWIPIIFIKAVESAFPIWAERQRSAIRNPQSMITLETLIADLVDENRNKDKKSSTAMYGGKPEKGNPKEGKGSGSKKDGRDKKKDSKAKETQFCKHCKDPKSKHKPEKCFVVDKEALKQYEEKTGRTFVPYKDRKENNKPKKSEDSDSDDEMPSRFNKKGKNLALLTANSNRHRTLFDTGADQHFSVCLDNYNEYKSKIMNYTIDTANGKVKPQGTGTRSIQCSTGLDLTLNNVLYLPGCSINIFGARQYIGRGELRLESTPKGTLVVDDEGDGLFYIDEQCYIIEQETHCFPAITTKPKGTSIRLWHRRLGHLGFDNVRKTAKLTYGIKLRKPKDLTEDQQEEGNLKLCDACELSKPHRRVRKFAAKRKLVAFDEIHLDVVSYKKIGIGGHRYATLFTDKATSVRWAYFYAKKNGAYDALVKFQKKVKTQYNRTIKKWRLDGGKEYSPKKLDQLAENLGQIVEKTTPHNPEQDGLSERSIGIICEKVRTTIIDMDIPEFLWPIIFESMVEITNKTATSVQEKTPYEVFLDEFYPEEDNTPSLAHLRTLGCKTYVEIPKGNRVVGDKTAIRAEVGILVGYEGQHIFKVYVPTRGGGEDNKIVRSSNVRFDEAGLITKPLPYEEDESDLQQPIIRGENKDRQDSDLIHETETSELSKNQDHQVRQVIIQPETVAPNNSAGEAEPFGDISHPEDSDFDDSAEQQSEAEPLPVPEVTEDSEEEELVISKKKGRPTGAKNKIHVPNPEFIRQTRSKNKSNQNNPYAHAASVFYSQAYSKGAETVYDDPETLAEAKARPDWPKWKEAIAKEYRGLIHKKTWKAMPKNSLPKGHNALSGKLVFRTKRNQAGEIIKYKARWVVKGCQQKKGRDFDQTFAGVCKSVTWKLVIALAALFDYEIEQMDVILAFLNSDADTDIYMKLPPGFEEEDSSIKSPRDTLVKLLKALYGLKQAPRLWQKLLTKELHKLGFEPCKSDPCVYFNKESKIIFVTYVDDILIVGPNLGKIKQLQKQLYKVFEMERLGPAQHFLGVRITRDRQQGKITLTQDAYINKILDRFGMTNSHPVDTPMATGAIEFMIPNTEQATYEDIKLYGSIVGSEMYLANQTRPDIAYTVNTLSRFLTNPSQAHIKAAKRVLQYLKGTKKLGLVFGGKDLSMGDVRLYGYSDADYATDKENRKSVSGNVFFFAGGAISASSKRQQTVAQSTTEAEYYALSRATSEAIWLKQIMTELHVPIKGYGLKSVLLYGDNQSSLNLADNSTFHQRTKHIDIKHHFIREHIASKTIDLWYVPTADMAADGLTKALTTTKHADFVRMLNMEDIEAEG